METITAIFGEVYQADGAIKKRRIRQVVEGSFIVYCRGSDRGASIFPIKVRRWTPYTEYETEMVSK
jgi:hypothetical protein